MKEYKLSELADIIGGGTPKTSRSDYWGGDIPWLSVVDFNNDFRHVFTTEKTITEAGLNNSSTRILYPGEIIISARGTVGALAQVAKEMAFNQSCYGLRAKPGITCNDYLFYLLRHSIETIKKNTHGSVFDTITRDTFESISVILPDLKTQQKVASILTAFDDKIELNAQINHNLEEQAKAIYATYFPYSVDDALPDDWRKGTLGEIIDLHDSKRIPLSGNERGKMEKIYPYYGAASLMDYVNDYLFDGVFLLLGEDGTVVTDNGLPVLQYVWGKFWVNNHAHILTGKAGFSVESLLLLLKQTPVKSIVTGAVQPKISQTNLKSIQIVVPPEKLLHEFNSVITPLFSLIRQNSEESKRLAQLRDTLLPKLMSGEIDVSEVEI